MSNEDNGGRVTPDIKFRSFISRYGVPDTGYTYLDLYLILSEKWGRQRAIYAILGILRLHNLATGDMYNANYCIQLAQLFG